MVQWVITVAGIAILAVICDIILPDGSTRKYIRTVIGVIVTLIMVQPIVGFVGDTLTFDDDKGKLDNIQIQQSYLDMVEDKQLEANLNFVRDILEGRGVKIQITDCNRENKTIALKSSVEYSVEKKSLIEKTFDAYFDGYKIKIEWK